MSRMIKIINRIVPRDMLSTPLLDITLAKETHAGYRATASLIMVKQALCRGAAMRGTVKRREGTGLGAPTFIFQGGEHRHDRLGWKRGSPALLRRPAAGCARL